ncbi:winged helix-turn-helix DNA-binding domain, heat shock transcription factor family protein [Tanacetum coccineum]
MLATLSSYLMNNDSSQRFSQATLKSDVLIPSFLSSITIVINQDMQDLNYFYRILIRINDFNRVSRRRDGIVWSSRTETTLSDIRNTIEPLTKKLISTFSDGVGRKRKFVDIDLIIDLVDIEKDLESMYDQFKVSDSDIEGLTTLSNLTEKVANVQGCRGGGACRRGEGRRVPPFLHKLYNMVEKQEIDDLISWNLPYRDSFIIWDTSKFAAHVLPTYFSHTNFGFSIRIVGNAHEYAHNGFLGGWEVHPSLHGVEAENVAASTVPPQGNCIEVRFVKRLKKSSKTILIQQFPFMGRLVDELHKKALEEDPSAFAYDELYDEMLEKKALPFAHNRQERKVPYLFLIVE